MKNRNDHLKELIAAEAAERLLAREEQAGDGDLLSWFRNSPLHIAEYLGMAKLSSDLALVAREIDYPLEKLVADARENSNIFELPSGDLRGAAAGTKPVTRPYLVRTALVLVLASIVGLGVSLTLTRSTPDSELRYTTGHGEERTIRMTDGTFVHLNTDSMLDVKFEPNVRLVQLERGEAYFEVAKASDRPFRVRVGTTEFQDVGTAFDVSAGNAGAVITVAEGRVRIVKAGSSARVNATTNPADVTAGQQATVSASGAIVAVTTPHLDQVLGWTRQQIVFDREAIRDVVAEFNRYNDVQIVVRDARIANIAISGNFHVRDERAFVAFLNHLPGVRTSETEGMIVIRAKAK
jgi:transmembrane sensor